MSLSENSDITYISRLYVSNEDETNVVLNEWMNEFQKMHVVLTFLRQDDV